MFVINNIMPGKSSYPVANPATPHQYQGAPAGNDVYKHPVIESILTLTSDLRAISSGINPSETIEKDRLAKIERIICGISGLTKNLRQLGMLHYSHDINSVLTGMGGRFDIFMIDYRAKEKPTDIRENDKLITYLQDGIEEIEGIIDPTPFYNNRIAESFNNTFHPFKSRFKEMGLAFEDDVPSDYDTMTYTNPGGLQGGFFLNLATNMEKYGITEGGIYLRKSDSLLEGGAWNGTEGEFTSKELVKMFEPGERLGAKDPDPGNEASNLGQGLANARAIIESYGGNLWAESGGRWVDFRFSLPIAEPPEE